ncbi:type II toxin-antitoxin system Phd/YefM family antitoxin [Deinococcus sp.]|uniref:type II toxin-antitoxin system Phd/YefM family antitoxin n=1 Tax=Deinococcus sp. TaxID=47478 RepID=UPI003CC568AD
MKTLNIHEAKAQLSHLVELVQQGEEVVIARYGKPLVRLVALQQAGERPLGFYPIEFHSDFAAPSDEQTIREFEGEEG